MPPRKKSTTAAAAASNDDTTKKRAAPASASTASVMDSKARDEAERFAARVALHLRESAETSGAPWDDATVKEGFKETVANMPEGALKQKLTNNFARFAEMIAEKTSRPSAAAGDLPRDGELGGPDHAEFHELKKPPRYDFDEMSLEELEVEVRRCLLRATFDLPCWLGDNKEERDSLESTRETSLERVADAAAAMVTRFAEHMNAAAATSTSSSAAAAAAAAAGGKSKGREKGGGGKVSASSADGSGKSAAAGERVSAGMIEAVSRTLARSQAYAALRRDGGGEDWSRERTHRAAARFPIMRQAFRRAMSKEEKPARDRRITAGHDAAMCCGHTRYFLVVELARLIPDDVGGGGGGDGDGDGDGGGGEGDDVKEKKKKKSKKEVVGKFGVADLPLFEAALGLSGFDEDFEAKITKECGVDFARLDAPAVHGAVGPALLPPFTPDAALAAADAVAFAPDATLTEIAASYEKALTGGNSEWNFNDDDSDDEGGGPDPAGTAEAEEMEYIAAYMSLLKVLRGAAALCVAGGNRRRAENVARFAARAPCPSLLLMHLPTRAAAADPKAASVELAAASSKLWSGALRAWAQVKDMLSDAAPGGGGGDDDDAAGGVLGGFFVDTTGDVDRAEDLAGQLSLHAAGSGLGEGEELSKEEEEDLIDMLRRNKSFLGGMGDSDDDDDVLDNLSDEEENLPAEASAAAAAAAATAAVPASKRKGRTPKKR